MDRTLAKNSPKLDRSHSHAQRLGKQLRDDLRHKGSQSVKLQRKMVNSQVKNSKPTMAIYRPPSVRISGDFSSTKLSNGSSPSCTSPAESCLSSVSDDSSTSRQEKNRSPSSHVHFSNKHSMDLSKDAGFSESSTTKSNLKRSKSFGAADQVYMAALSFDKDSFRLDGNNFVSKACQDPNKLSCRQLMEVVRVICNQAVDNCKNAEPAAQLCISIIEKEKGSTFVESLENCCREWFNEKDKLLRGPLSVAGVTSSAMRWISYLYFISQLYQVIKDRTYRRNYSVDTSNICITLNMLLFESFVIIMKPPSIHNTEEVECMHSILVRLGRELDCDTPQRMRSLVMSMRESFVSPSITLNTTVKKLFLELIELYASRWQFDMPQSVYYFPYTTRN